MHAVQLQLVIVEVDRAGPPFFKFLDWREHVLHAAATRSVRGAN